MVRGEYACLDRATWFESLGRLSASIAVDAPAENMLRLANCLARLAPPPLSTLSEGVEDEARFEALLESASFEAAALTLLGGRLSHRFVARSAAETTADVWLEGDGPHARARAPSAALALLGAWLAYLRALEPREEIQVTGTSHRSA